jgi:hypothetical protein
MATESIEGPLKLRFSWLEMFMVILVLTELFRLLCCIFWRFAWFFSLRAYPGEAYPER